MFSQNQKYFLILLIIALLTGSILAYLKPFSINKPVKEMIIKESSSSNPNTQTSFIFIHLSGEVKNPGVYKIKENSRLVDLLKISGGLTKMADIDIINLVQPLSDGQKISIPKKDLYIINNTQRKSSSNQLMRININFANLETLKNLPGIGDKIAQKIIDFREKNGLFKTTLDLKKVPGIGDKMFEKIKDQLVL